MALQKQPSKLARKPKNKAQQRAKRPAAGKKVQAVAGGSGVLQASCLPPFLLADAMMQLGEVVRAAEEAGGPVGEAVAEWLGAAHRGRPDFSALWVDLALVVARHGDNTAGS